MALIYFAVCSFLQKLILTNSIKYIKVNYGWRKKMMKNNMGMFIGMKIMMKNTGKLWKIEIQTTINVWVFGDCPVCAGELLASAFINSSSRSPSFSVLPLK